MRIAVLGSWRSREAEWSFKHSHTEFAQACFELGRALARNGQRIVVGGSSDSTADAHVVRGFLAGIAGIQVRGPLIRVFRPGYNRDAYHDEAINHPGLFAFAPSVEERWAGAHLMQIREADAVLIIGGADGTYNAGLAALVAKKRLVPVGSFGGAAERLLGALHALHEPQADALEVLNAPWTPMSANAAMDALAVGVKPTIIVIHGRSPDRFELLNFLKANLQLNDLLMMQAEFGAGRTLPEKFEGLAAKADGAIAIATPDDVGGLAESALLPRARQNVWIEVGWIWGRLGRDKVALLTKGNVDIPSDLDGIEFYSYGTSLMEVSESIRAFVTHLGKQN
jgi:predicted nucleotide-binding protein/predicted Rossmann-fold nucleotide-binding protein